MASTSSSSDPSSTASTSATTSSERTQDSISALEYLNQQEELESSARDILPYSFRQCTGPLGPLRQAVYACLTCSPVPPESQHGGICYSCSIQCHGSHNLVELFCKRDFTCDCGTTRMGETPCSLRKVSRNLPNSKNSYNHNFEGRFCDCDQIYDVDAEEGTMFQCLVCEDWFHERCIGEGRVPDQDDFDAFVCQTCVGKNEWLGRYVGDKTAFMSTLETYPEAKVDVETVEEAPVSTVQVVENVPASSMSMPVQMASTEQTDPSSPSNVPTSGVKRSLSTEPETPDLPPKRVKSESEEIQDTCKWASLPPTPAFPFALFLKETFRDKLCRCLDCETTRLRTLPMISHEEETYEPDEDNSDTGIPPSFLTLSAAEFNVSDSLLEAGTRALSSLPRTQALDGIVAYQALSTKLKTFLQGFAETGRVVSEADVRGFFAEMQNDAPSDVASQLTPDTRKEESAK